MRFHTRILFLTTAFVFVLALSACSSPAEPTAPTIVDTPVPAVVEQTTDTPLPAVDPTPVPAQEATQTSGAGASTAPPDTDNVNPILFVVDPTQSEARFVIDEELMGSPNTVVGVNGGVSGEVTVDPGDPSTVLIGPIVIEAGGFVTDSDRRNGAINRFILQSNSYPNITFTPTAIEGVPASVSIGDTLNLQVSGDLTIREITRPETFAVTVQVVSTSELRVSGTTQILRENYGLTIPSVPSVANVTNEVQLEFDFVTVPQ